MHTKISILLQKKPSKWHQDVSIETENRTLSRLLPLMIAVGKYFATFLTAARICDQVTKHQTYECIANVFLQVEQS